ncbi:MAG: CD225/dispanin family protein, partial [Planctomycetaceae bacterium]|nr:CD225/dispanin family protein [Planctomycetaceae bacterium]
MNCVHCGTNLPDNATFCTACGSAVAVNPPQTPFNQYSPTGQGNYGAPGTYGQPGDYRPPPPKIPNYLIWSIFSTICCCLPLGIAAIIFSVQSQSALTAGNFAKAAQDSKTAFYCN